MHYKRLLNKVKRKLGFQVRYPSETSKVRHLVTGYCLGYGCDIGFGGDKVLPSSIGIDFASPYANTGKDQVDIACDVIADQIPVADNTFDYVYTSHLIEDFENTTEGLEKFVRILKDKGTLILVFPDQRAYEAYCKISGQSLNAYHKHADMGLSYMLNALSQLPNISYELLYSSNCEIDYNVILALKISKHGKN
jgi:predicted SAM-dependent methyltransferase